MKQTTSLHVDHLAYAVAMIEGAGRFVSPNEPLERVGIPFHLLIGFGIESALKALLEYQSCGDRKNWTHSHDLADLLSRSKDLEERLWPGVGDMVRLLSRYHKEHWFRYPKKASIANVYKPQSTLMAADNLVREVFALTKTELEDARAKTGVSSCAGGSS